MPKNAIKLADEQLCVKNKLSVHETILSYLLLRNVAQFCWYPKRIFYLPRLRPLKGFLSLKEITNACITSINTKFKVQLVASKFSRNFTNTLTF